MKAANNLIEMPIPETAKRRIGRVKLTDAVVEDFVLQGADRKFGPEEKHASWRRGWSHLPSP